MKRVAAKTRSEGQGGLHGVVEVDLPLEVAGPDPAAAVGPP